MTFDARALNSVLDRVAAEGLTMATDLVVGVPLALFGVDYGGVSLLWADEDAAPTAPEDFETKNF